MSADTMSPGDVSPREWIVRIFERGNRSSRDALMRPPYLPWTGPNWFRCADGKALSIIAGYGTYCSPRPGMWDDVPDDYTGPFTAVEVWFPGDGEPRGHVTAAELWAYINEHGGVTEYLPPMTTPSEAGWL